MDGADESMENAHAEKTDLVFYIRHLCRQFTLRWGSLEVAARNFLN